MGEEIEHPERIILHPVYKEKTMNMRDDPRENKLEFIVHRDATRTEIKRAIEQMLDVRVKKVNVRITRGGKRAIVKFAKGYSAIDLGVRLGIS